MPTALIAHIYRLIQRPSIQILSIVLFGGLAYSNTFHVPFVFDDYPVIVGNRTLDSLSTFFNSIPWTDFTYKSRWVALATFAFNKNIGGTNVTGFHIINLLIHLSTGITVYFLAKTTLASFGEKIIHRYSLAPLMASLGFVLHPVQTQAVSYVVQRMTSLATLFYLGTLLLYAKIFMSDSPTTASTSLRHKLFYLGAIISCLFAMSTKEISFTLPLTIALFDICFLEGTVRQRLVRLFPFVLCMLVMPFYLVGIEKGIDVVTHGGGDEISFPLPRLTYLYTEFRVIITYMRLLILPVAQNLDYDYPVYTSFFQTQVLASLALIIALFGYGFYFLKTSQKHTCRFPALLRISGFAILWFFITLSIESGMVPLIDTIFEHRLYLPSVWFFVAIAVVIAELYQGSKTKKQFVATATVILIAISGYATYQRNNVWSDRYSLWADVVKKAPNNIRALTNLGKYYVDILDPATAIPLLERAVSIEPKYSPAHYSLGLALIQRGDPERALKHFETTTKLAPNGSKGWEEAGRLLFERGDYGNAAFFMRRALEIDPNAFTSQEKSLIFRKL